MNTIPDTVDPLDFYQSLLDLTRNLPLKAGLEYFIAPANKGIRLIFSGQKMMNDLIPAFEHIGASDKLRYDLTIYSLDLGTIPGRAVAFPRMEKYGSRGRDIPFLIQEGITISLWRESRSMSILNKRERIAFFLSWNSKNLAYYEKAAPFRSIFQWWFDHENSALLHSGAVGAEGEAFLISGQGGAGKSTTAFSCMLDGMDYLGDDYVIVSEDKGFRVSSLYNSVKLTDDAIKMFPGREIKISNPCFSNEEKGLIFIRRGLDSNHGPDLRIKGILLPQVRPGEKTTFQRVRASSGFRSLAPSTIFQYIGRRDNISKFIGELTRKIPCYKLYVGSDQKQISRTVQKMLKEV